MVGVEPTYPLLANYALRRGLAHLWGRIDYRQAATRVVDLAGSALDYPRAPRLPLRHIRIVPKAGLEPASFLG